MFLIRFRSFKFAKTKIQNVSRIPKAWFNNFKNSKSSKFQKAVSIISKFQKWPAGHLAQTLCSLCPLWFGYRSVLCSLWLFSLSPASYTHPSRPCVREVSFREDSVREDSARFERTRFEGNRHPSRGGRLKGMLKPHSPRDTVGTDTHLAEMG